jgi:Subtilase family
VLRKPFVAAASGLLVAGLLSIGSTAAATAAAAPAGAAGAAGGVAPATAAKVPWLIRDRAAKIVAAQHAGTMSPATAKAAAGTALDVTPAGAIDVVVHATGAVDAADAAALTALGATVTGSSADFAAVPGADLPTAGLISARVPADRIDAVAALPWVAALRPAIRPATDAGPVTSDGVPLHRADVAAARGLTGRGQKIGAMSDGVTSLAASVAAGELPADVQVLDPGDGDEGTGMLEELHDMAPGAKLAFAGTGETLESHVAGLRSLAAAGAGLITEDLAFDDEPAFQQGLAATTAEKLAVHGVFVSSSAGNLGGRHAPRVVATGTGATPDGVPAAGNFASCPNVPDNLVDITGTGDNTFDLRLAGNGAILATLQWSEPRAIFPTPGQGGFTDLNLYVLNAAGTDCLASSASVQANGVGDTLEQLEFDNPSAAPVNLKLAVDVQGTSTAVRPPLLDLRWRNAGALAAVNTPARAGSMNPDSNYLFAATSAAAVNSSVSTDPAATPIEAFSAGGPVQVGSTTVCPFGRAGPCRGVRGLGFATRTAPTWAAADGVSISGAGGFPNPAVCPTEVQGQCRFFGTSAAAPSAAGVAAVVRQATGGHLPAAALNLVLAGLAVDRGDPGRDNVFGAGVLQAVPARVTAPAG